MGPAHLACIRCSMSVASSGNTSGEPSIRICTHLANQAAIHSSAHPCIYSLIHHSTRPPIYPPSRNPLCISPRIHPSVHSFPASIHPSATRTPMHPSIRAFTQTSIHRSINASIHPSIHPSESLASMHNRPRRNARSDNNLAMLKPDWHCA